MCFELPRAGITHTTTNIQALLQQQKYVISDKKKE